MSSYTELDTPALLINKDQVLDNIRFIQDYVNRYKVNLRPHTKTHKMPYLAKLQIDGGAKGISVAKVGEAEVMAENGIETCKRFSVSKVVDKWQSIFKELVPEL